MNSAHIPDDVTDRRWAGAGATHIACGRLEGKVAIVTGAGTLDDGWGNGKAAAVLFAREGASVLAVDRRLDAAESTAELIHSAGGTCIPLAVDVSKEEQVQQMVRTCLEEFGRIDVLQNNVGVGIAKPTREMSLKEWDLVQRINVTSMFLSIRECLPTMIERGQGSIINVSSIASLRWTGVAFIGYSSSKGAVNQLTQAIAMEHARDGVRCNAVVPGLIDTPTVYAGLAADGDPEALRAERNRACPTGSMGDAWDVAYASLFLASDESSYITGQLLTVDGGLSLQTSNPPERT